MDRLFETNRFMKAEYHPTQQDKRETEFMLRAIESGEYDGLTDKEWLRLINRECGKKRGKAA